MTSYGVRKQLYSMQYIIGKITAVEFCEKFEETIRNYENSPGATPLSEDEKRDAFYNAVMISVPAVQSIEFLSKNTKGISPDYEQLKNLVMQDEATRKQLTGETNEVRAANLAQREIKRCYKCQAIGHIAKDCSNKGILCYCCQKFGNHKAPDCPEANKNGGESNKARDYLKVNNNFNRYSNSSRGSGVGKFKQLLKRKSNWAYEGNAKRGRFRSDRGRGNYKNSNQNNNNPKLNKQGNQRNAEKSSEGNSTSKGMLSVNYSEIETMYTNTTKSNEKGFFTKFLVDSGATEHLTNSKIIFKNFDELDCGVIKCANQNESADLKTEGAGRVEIKLKNGRVLEIEKMIFAKALKENLLSLRKFAEMGLAIYLDDKEINIFDPISKEKFISGIYKRPYWIIEIRVDKNKVKGETSSSTLNKLVIANLAEQESVERKYFTRSMAAKENLVKQSKEQKVDEHVDASKEMRVDEIIEEKLNEKQERAEIKNKRDIPYEQSNFDITIWDRKFHDIDELPYIDQVEEVSIFSNENNKISKNDKAMLWHVRFGHASKAYLRSLQLKFPENKELNSVVFGETISKCEVCLI